MTRSRAFNRFHRFLARKHRDEIRNTTHVLSVEDGRPCDRVQQLIERRFALDDRLEMEETAR
jgi:hypothetical protein